MSALLSWAITLTLVLYAVALLLGLLRLIRGPSAHDRVMAVDFLYIVALLMLLVLAIRFDSRVPFEAALLMGLLGFVGSLALAKFLLRGEAIE